VDTTFNKLGAETKPAVWKKRVVDANDALETYPADPRPITVEVRFGCKPIPATVDKTVEANSVGSINVLMYRSRPKVVERSCEDEI
jgi:hypothetical protein